MLPQMAIARRLLGKESSAQAALAERDALRVAQQHLGELAKIRRPVPAESRVLRPPRLRRFARRLAGERERLILAAEWVRRAAVAPHHPLGRFIVRLRFTLKGLVNLPLLTALAAFALVAVWRLAIRPPVGSVGDVVSGALFGAVLIGAIAITWNDLVRCPFSARRIRRRIAKRPESVLATTSPNRKAELMARDEKVPIVPREDLFDEILPGILDRRRGDIQMVVGEPGAGKTTALVGLAGQLARMGIVPVVVPMWGGMQDDPIVAAEKRFKRYAGSLIGSSAHLDNVWRWLRAHRRVVVAIDDVDRIAPDGERGFMLRRGLDELAGEDLPAVVTTRPAGIPAGLAASAIKLEELDQEAAVDHVLRVAWAEPAATSSGPPTANVRGNVERWVREGRFAEVPFYLELLARLVAVGRCDELPPAHAVLSERDDASRARQREDGRCEWNPLWVRFRLLEHFHREIAEGRVHQWLAIEARERKSCLAALSEVALSTLGATAMRARVGALGDGASSAQPSIRLKIEEFLESDDRAKFVEGGQRTTVSAHEVVDTGERLRILDRDPTGELHFHHRIMQAYLASRCLVERGTNTDPRREGDWMEVREPPDWIGALLDPCHPERLTAQMTLTFAALRATEGARSVRHPAESQPRDLVTTIQDCLLKQAKGALPEWEPAPAGNADKVALDDKRLDPREPFHPEQDRADPDDALAKLTTAAEIARATGAEQKRACEIVECARSARGATMWTKLHAIPSIAALNNPMRWHCMWEFARDPDQEVRRAASEAIADDAFAAYSALESSIKGLLTRAALRSAHGVSLDAGGTPATGEGRDGRAANPTRASARDGEIWDAVNDAPLWDAASDPPSLQALGWILPAMVSGLREHLGSPAPDGPGEARDDGPDDRQDGDRDGAQATTEPAHAGDVRGAREALEQFVVLAFQGGNSELEASLAQGFKSDAMRHASDPNRMSGPGLVANNRRFVADFCIDNAEYWYARLALHQALALYTIAGSSRQVAFDVFGRLLRRGVEPHPFVWRAGHLARRAVERHAIGSDRWASLIWVDEGVAVSRRPSDMSRGAAQLVADVTLLLNLRERAPEDRQAHFPHMRELPYCLHGSADRHEILGAGCPPGCGYGLCPLKQPPPDEPNGQRTVSRAFCRGQYEIAGGRKPPWQKRSISRRVLQEFWRQMERRART